jgi:hypothetical protein
VVRSRSDVLGDGVLSPEQARALADLAAAARLRRGRSAPSLSLCLPRVEIVALAGVARPVMELRLCDLADLQGWLADQVPHPLAGVPPAWADPDPATRPDRLKAAWRRAREWPPKLGTPQAGEVLGTPAGLVAFVLVCLRRCDPSVTATDAAEVAAKMGPAEWATLRRIAWGRQPWEELREELDPSAAEDPGPPPDWAEGFQDLAATTGWTFEQIGELTVTQYRIARSGTAPAYRGLVRGAGETLEQLAARERETFGG